MDRLHLALALVTVLCSCRGIEPVTPPAPIDGAQAARAALGQMLFFDPRLSRDGDLSCASCHRPDHGGAEPRAHSIGTDGAEGHRNAPSVLNAALKTVQFWDGRAATLEAQALGPLFNPAEMATDEPALLAFLSGTPGYVRAFAAAFPESEGAIDLDQVARAIAEYERRLVWPGRVDRFLAGDSAALTAEERAGYDYFNGNCAFCHDGSGIGGQRIERLGDQVAWPESRSADVGVMALTGNPDDRLRFVVPSLRHVGSTAPYFHDGSVETLDEAIRLMARHQLGEELDDTRVQQVAAFLRALDGEVPNDLLAPPMLP